jgi:sporulation protein YlmC with PRC-barrel domain
MQGANLMKTTIAAGVAMLALTTGLHAPAVAQNFQTAQKPGEIMTYRLGGTRVFNAKGDLIGHVNDIILDDKGQAQTVVIGLGGVLGVGAKLVAVPFSAVKVGPVVESARVVLLDMTTDQLNKAPAFKGTDPGKGDRAQQKASEWAKIAKQKAIELGNQAGTAIQGVRERMQTPAPAGGATAPAAPAPAAPAPAAPKQ